MSGSRVTCRVGGGMIVPLGSRRGDHAHCPPIHATTPRKHLDPVAAALQLAPATGAVVGDDVLEHGGEGGRVDRFALSDGHGAGSRVFVAAGDDPLGIGDDAAVVEEHVDVVPGRQQGADVALQDEVRTVGALDGFGTSRSAAWTSSRTSRQIACCQSGRAPMYASTRGSAVYAMVGPPYPVAPAASRADARSH